MLSLNLLFAIRSLLPPGNESFYETVIAAISENGAFRNRPAGVEQREFQCEGKTALFFAFLDSSIVSNMLANLFSMILQRVNIYLPRAGVGF
jgi:hypothetical protein